MPTRTRDPQALRKQSLKKYGLTIEHYDLLLAEQGGVCAICSGVQTDGKMLSVDHDHLTKQIRGLLCRRCNIMLGYARDCPGVLRMGADYLDRHEALCPEEYRDSIPRTLDRLFEDMDYVGV
jgi:hypothetical protein